MFSFQLYCLPLTVIFLNPFFGIAILLPVPPQLYSCCNNDQHRRNETDHPHAPFVSPSAHQRKVSYQQAYARNQ
jgi:hypothetical protein